MWLSMFFFYHIVNKINFRKNHVIRHYKVHWPICEFDEFNFFKKFIFFQFHLSILNWFGIEFHNLFYFSFYKVIVISKNISVLDWCLILRLFIFVIIQLNKFFFFKKQVINPSGVHDSIHRYNMLTQVTRFTSLTSLPIELDIYFSFWSFIFLFHHLILDLLRNIFHNLFFFRFYKVITI
jgi:hypothetical protein